ncbi:MAG: type III-B CRISPR module RAMP protein Cmr6 [Candidatus Cloacimonas sp. 4484_209]|nr:MAG: type III-B CRISPR module RAMP protein Cmr6 [Candidatus Cloacimonas sp. 4484_209]
MSKVEKKKGILSIDKEKNLVKVLYQHPKRPDKKKQLTVHEIKDIPEKYDGQEVIFTVLNGNRVVEIEIIKNKEKFVSKRWKTSMETAFKRDNVRIDKHTGKSPEKDGKGKHEEEYIFFLPSHLRQLMKSVYMDIGRVNKINPSLFLYKYTPGKDLDDPFSKIAGKHWERFEKAFSSNDEFHKASMGSQQILLHTIDNENWYIKKIQKKLQWRMVVGLGTNHPYEVSMRLHHIYGVPIIPGSALKGIARDMALIKIAKKEKKEVSGIEEKVQKYLAVKDQKDAFFATIKSKEFSNLTNEEKLLLAFGNQQFSGIVVFLDAIPDSAPKFKVDIMNPHVQKHL